VLGEPELATAEKGKAAYEEAVKQLCRYVAYFTRGRKTCARTGSQETDDIDPVGAAAAGVKRLWNFRPIAAARGTPELAKH